MSWPTLESMILAMLDRLSRIESHLSSNSQRLERMDHRQDRLEDRLNRDKVRFPDLLPYILGLTILVLTYLGKPELAAAVATVLGR